MNNAKRKKVFLRLVFWVDTLGKREKFSGRNFSVRSELVSNVMTARRDFRPRAGFFYFVFVLWIFGTPFFCSGGSRHPIRYSGWPKRGEKNKKNQKKKYSDYNRWRSWSRLRRQKYRGEFPSGKGTNQKRIFTRFVNFRFSNSLMQDKISRSAVLQVPFAVT